LIYSPNQRFLTVLYGYLNSGSMLSFKAKLRIYRMNFCKGTYKNVSVFLFLLANASDTVVFIEEGLDKGLVVAATGIGKTYIAAFDSLNFNRILFVAHREEILILKHYSRKLIHT